MSQINRRYFPAVDGLRTLCVALVMLDHIHSAPVFVRSTPTWLGVDVFFLISGFIITTLLFREEAEKGKVDLYAFYVRRFFRIVPLYFAILAGYFVTAIPNPHRWHLMLRYAWYYLTLCGEFIKLLPSDPANVPPFGATWTLGIEEKFYLVWPLIFFILMPRKWRLAIIPVLMALVLPLNKFWMTRSYIGLLMGCMVAILLQKDKFLRYQDMVKRIPVVIPFLLVILGFYLVSVNWVYVFFFDAAGMFLLSSILLRDSWFVSFLSFRPVVWLGRRSYSMYLLHTIALDVMEHFLHGATYLQTSIVLCGGMAIAAAGATATFRLIEEPCRLYGKRMLARRGHTPSSISPAAAVAGNDSES